LVHRREADADFSGLGAFSVAQFVLVVLDFVVPHALEEGEPVVVELHHFVQVFLNVHEPGVSDGSSVFQVFTAFCLSEEKEHGS